MSRQAICALIVSSMALLIVAGCAPCGPQAEPQAKAEPMTYTPPPEAPPSPPCGTSEMHHVARHLPSSQQCSTILLEKAAPEQVRVGETFEYHIKATNTSDVELLDVTVWDTVLSNFRVVSVDPAVSETRDGWHIWNLGNLEPGEGRLIRIEGVATGVTRLQPCAEVTYRMPQVCLAIDVVQPSLQLTKSAPSERLQCDPIPVTLTITNTGSGPACDVVITDPLPDGLTTLDGSDQLEFVVGQLDPGQSREFTAQLRANSTGAFSNRAVATADGGLRVQSNETMTEVLKPDLSVTLAGPDMRYIGRPAEYNITLGNGPEVEASNTVLTFHIPDNAQFVSASEGAERMGNRVVWNLGTVDTRQIVNGTVTLQSNQAGVLRPTVDVTASCGEAQAQAQTTIRGIAAILLEVVDQNDPVEVGGQEVYTITVTNQGSAPGTGIRVTAMLPQEQTYVSSAGPTDASVSGQTIEFAPLGSLAPGAQATYRVTVRGTAAGDVRFRATLTSNEISDPAVEETEATRFYE